MNGVLSIPLAFHASNQLDQSSCSLPTLPFIGTAVEHFTTVYNSSDYHGKSLLLLFFFASDSQWQCSLLSHNLLCDQDGQKLHLTTLCTFCWYSVGTKSGTTPPPPPPFIAARTCIFADHSPKYCSQAVKAVHMCRRGEKSTHFHFDISIFVVAPHHHPFF